MIVAGVASDVRHEIRGRRNETVRIPFASLVCCACFVLLSARIIVGQSPPTLATVFPMGGKAGQTVDVVVGGSNLQELRTLHCNGRDVRCERLEPDRFRLTIPAEVPPGLYDLWAQCDGGISAPRTFQIGNRGERAESEPNESVATAMPIPLDHVVNGRIDKPGDGDHFRFEAKQGQRVLVECWAERIDSRLRAILEIFDATGRRLSVNRGYQGIDPLIDFRVPSDGAYVVTIQDLISAGSAEHYYRLDIDTGPRVAFAVPTVIERGKPARVTLYGWNLTPPSQLLTSSTGSIAATTLPTPSTPPAELDGFDKIEWEVPASSAHESWPLPVGLQPSQVVLEGSSFSFHFPGGHAPIVMGISDVPVALDRAEMKNHSSALAQEIAVPSEVSGQLVAGDEQDWFKFQARRGEVFHIDALGQRIHSPVDLEIGVFGIAGEGRSSPRVPNGLIPERSKTLNEYRELAQFGDDEGHAVGVLSSSTLDPAGRWISPADGLYLISVRNLIGGLQADPRRIYRLRVRREDPDFQVVAAPHRADPAGLNVQRGGREVFDLLAFRRRGFNGPIRVSATEMPAGIECPDVWLGQGVDRATLVVSADRKAAAVVGELKLKSVSEVVGTSGIPDSEEAVRHNVVGASVVRAGTPGVWSRLVSQIPLAIAGDSPLRMTADGHETLDHHLYGKLQVRHSPGGILDVAVHIQRRDSTHHSPVKLIGEGIPDLIQNQTAFIPAGQEKGFLSFYLPPTLPVGRYSLVVRGETTVPTSDQKTEKIIVFSNPVTFDVQPAAFLVQVDPFAVTRAKRGEVIQIGYSAQRLNGFIGKMHTELASPDRITDVVGLRGRGETFVGQTDKGSLQIIINDDAPLGRQPFLRLLTVGVLEDEPLYHGSSFLTLEIEE